MRLFGELCTSGKFVFFFLNAMSEYRNIIYLLYVLIICIICPVHKSEHYINLGSNSCFILVAERELYYLCLLMAGLQTRQ